jgi:phage terminase small subunit
MPVLSNSRHERFAQALASGKSQSEAYVAAGYKYDEPNASRLTRNDKIRARVTELQGNVAKRVEVTLESLLEEAEEIRQRALEAGSYAAAITAVKEKGVLAGLRVEKRENRHLSVDEVSDADLAAIALGQTNAATAH